MSENRLANQSSPYLLQHAHNPVDWFPWGDDAFAEARRRDVPIFLSIGYSTCYWCHVMERERFGAADIAPMPTRPFVCVKGARGRGGGLGGGCAGWPGRLASLCSWRFSPCWALVPSISACDFVAFTCGARRT